MTKHSWNRGAQAFAPRTTASLSIAFVTLLLAARGSRQQSAAPLRQNENPNAE